MVEIETTRHAKFQIAYHFVWIPKYRKNILQNDLKIELIHEIARQFGFQTLALEIMSDHVHLLNITLSKVTN